MDTRELQEAVEEYQTGNMSSDDEMLEGEGDFAIQANVGLMQTRQPVIGAAYDDANDEESRTAHEEYINRIMNIPLGRGTYEDLTEEAVNAGFGTSRYDSSYVSGMDLEDSRAQARSGFANIMAGLLKGGVRTVGTAVNTTAGTLVGLGSGIAELFLDMDNDGKRGAMEMFDAATNNWVSSQIVKLEDKFEEIVPNYRTAQERTEKYQKQWYKPGHMFSSNSIADFLSNMGFTAGAMLGGMGVSKLLGKLKSKQLANDILKSSVMAAEGDANATAELKNIAESIKNGNIQVIDWNKLPSNIKNVAKRINATESRLQLYGAAISALGEGTIEGIMAKNEFLEDFGKRTQDEFNAKYQALEEELLAEGDSRYVNIMNVIDENGEELSIPVLNSDGAEELERRRRKAINEYRDTMYEADIQSDRLAAVTNILNFPVLTLSNFMLYGRMLSGGWKTSRRNAGKIAGRAKVGRSGISSEYKAVGKWRPTIINTLKTMAGEGSEEMLQGAISSGEQAIAEEKLTAFVDAGYDSSVIQNMSGAYLNAFRQGAVDYLGDIKNWNEGFMGAITGLIGIPGRRWGGGLVGSYHDANEKSKVSKEAANKLNGLVNSREFQDRWRGFIRHMRYDNDLRNAIAADDQYAWHTADDKQLIGDVIAFADAGKINDLYDIVNYYKNISSEDIGDIRQVLSGQLGGNSENDWINNASDDEIAERVRSQAEMVSDGIESYRNLYDAISSIAPHDASPDYLRELVATSMQIERYDRRFLEMLDDVMPHINDAAFALSTLDENNNIRTPGQVWSEAEKIKSAYESIIAGELAPVELPEKFRKIQESILDEIEDVVKNDSETLKKVQDMRKVSDARKRFYRKLKYLRTRGGQERFENEKPSQQKADDAAEQALAAMETSGINSLNDVKRAYFEKNAKDRDEFINTLRSVVNKKPEVQGFLDIIDKFDSFVEYVNKHNPDFASNPQTSPAMVMNMLEDIPRRAQSVDDVEKLPDTIFQNVETFKAQNNNAFGLPIGESEYEATKSLIRGMMKSYLELDSATASRNMENPNVQLAIPAGSQNSEVPTGRDAAQGGSAVAPPVAVAEKELDKPKVVNKKPVTPSSGNEIEYADVKNQSGAEKEEDAVDNIPIEDSGAVNGEDVKKDDKKLYYHTSVPEIDSRQAASARDAIQGGDAAAYHHADLSDFVIAHPEYAPIWNALHDAGAFEYVANKLKVGDKIKFIIDPVFPQYEGKPQILMATEVDGKNQILSVLSLKDSEYYGLNDLRDAILKEYESFKNSNPNEVFEYGKQSDVWCKRDGLIEYSETFSDKSIKDIPSYSDDAPIVFIDGDGNALFVRRGNTSLGMPVAFTDKSKNLGLNGQKDRRGHLYYIVNSGSGYSIPIRLNVEHFRDGNKNNNSFGEIRSLISSIADIVSSSDNTNIREKGSALADDVGKLAAILDLHDVDFVLQDWGGDIGVALAINTRDTNGELVSDRSRMFRPSQSTISAIMDFIASLEKSLNIKYSPRTRSIINLDSLIDSGAITANVKMLRAKGVDFYCDAYNPQTGEFEKITPVIPQDVKPEEPVVAPEPGPIGGNNGDEIPIEFTDQSGVDDFDDIYNEIDNDVVYDAQPEYSAERRGEIDNAEMAALGDAGENSNMEFNSLAEDVKKLLIEKGYTDDKWNGMSDELREKILNCLF